MIDKSVHEALHGTDVSRETLDRLKVYTELVKKWNPRINLVSKRSLEDLWVRHILDSVQLYGEVENFKHWLDIGSGGGFPGMVIGILSASQFPEMKVTLIESDKRKCTFLKTVARETDTKISVLSERIEQAEPQNADVVSARALADLKNLLEFAERHLVDGGTALFPKGVTWQREVENAQKEWHFDYEVTDSLTQSGAVILKVKGASRV